MEDVYKKSKGNAGLDGIQFQISLSTVFLLNALRKLKGWRISTENEDAGKFDDVVLELSDGSAVLLQAKHKDSKRITKDQLLTDNSKNADFSLSKYFFSYQEIKPKFTINNIIICTNADIDGKNLQNVLTHQSVSCDSILHPEREAYCFTTFNENILSDLKENAEIYYDKNIKGKGVDKGVITDENVKHFLEKLQFFSNYPSGDDLNKVIDRLLSRRTNSQLLRGIACEEIYRKVEDWFKEKRGEYLNEPRAIAMFCEIRSDRYCKKLKDYNVLFAKNNFTFTGPKRIFHVTINGLCLLQSIKIHHSLRDQENKILLINPDDGIQVQKHAVEAFRMSRYTFLVLILLKVSNQREVKAMSDILKEILNNFKYKKVILITENNKNVAQAICMENDILQVDGFVSFDEFSQDSQERLVTKNNITFQGDKVSVKQLIDEPEVHAYSQGLDAEVLEGLVKEENIKVGTAPSGLGEDTAGYYIERTFDREIIATSSSMSLEGLLGTTSALDLTKETASVLLEKSMSNVSTLNQVKLAHDTEFPESPRKNKNKEKRKETVTEKSIFNVKEKVILISDSAGTGKSTVLTKLAVDVKQKYPHMWIIRIELNSYSRFLRESVKKKKRIIKITELLNADSATKLTNALEKFVFTVKEKVVIMLDGFDEISPNYTKLVLSLVSQCQEGPNIAKLIVTTRPHMSGELEALLQVKPFVLQSFTKEDQIAFLTSYWMHNLKVQSHNRDKCGKYCISLIDSISSWIKGGNNFTAVPLQVRMLAEIFQENNRWRYSTGWEGCREFLDGDGAEPILPERMKVTKLYEMFIQKKLDLFIDKANPSGSTAANRLLISMFDVYFMNHQSLAVSVIFKGADKKFSDLFPHRELDENMEIHMLQIGIVQKVNGKLDFVHRTFAEYFVAKSLLDISELDGQSINQNVDFQHFFIDEILCNPQYSVIRAFLDSSLIDFVHSLPSNVFDNYRLLIKSDPNSRKYRYDLIHLLASEGCLSILQLILKCINFTVIRNKAIIIQEQHENHNTLDFFQSLVQQGGINLKNESGSTPLHYAVQGHLDMTKFLVQQGADVNGKDAEGWTALHRAAREGHLHIVTFLVNSGADVSLESNDGTTPIHSAAWGGHTNIIRYFTEQGLDISVKNDAGTSPLHLAAQRGHLEVMKYLVEHGTDIEVKTNDGSTPLLSAATQSNLEAVKLLVERGADVDIKNSYGTTLIHCAARYGFSDMATFLVDRLEDFNYQDGNGFTTLHAAAAGGHLKIVQLLVERGVDVDIVNNEGFTALHAAATSGHLETVSFLAEHANVNIRNTNGVTALHTAVGEGYLDTVKVLIEHGADVNVRFDDDVSTLHVAAERGHLDILEYLIENGVDIGVLSGNNSTALHFAAAKGRLEIVKFLIDRGMDVNFRNKSGNTPLDLAGQNGHLSLVKFFTESGIDVENPTTFFAIIANDHLDIAKYLLERIDDRGEKNKYGAVLLQSAAHFGDIKAMKFLLDCGMDVNNEGSDGFTPLHIAAEKNQAGAAKFLVDHGAGVDIRNRSGNTALYLAASYGHLEVVTYLTEHRSDLNAKGGYGFTALMVAALRGYLGVVKRLLESGADVNAKKADGSVAVHFAAENGNVDIIDMLVNYGADVNARNYDGYVPLHAASSTYKLDAVKCLVRHGADPNLRNDFGVLPLFCAAKIGHLEMVNFLMSISDSNVIYMEGHTALYEAALGGHLPVVVFLAGKGVNVNGRHSSGATALHAAAHFGHLDTVKFLATYADLNVRNSNGSTPLHEAASNGHVDSVILLVEQGADVKARDCDDHTPLHLAAANGHLGIVKYFMERNQ